ncbi:3-galactosyl-N-acetylglucosaminide 4-alpha-L-fucosyltransferase FUT3-like [Equus asinus]|uniref:3-galactosyl-N-acetylglucosaminide 4-alpha-L-fucosyltransferase FUT3-like n=1 Tax=Equus asinus TaxID=9793 RepID=UPI0038F7B826
MDALSRAKIQCPLRHCVLGLLLQFLLALCFFSYLRVSPDKLLWPTKSGATAVESVSTAPTGSAEPGSSKGTHCQATAGPPARPPLLLLLWTWPFHVPVALSRCSELWPGTPDCQLTLNRSLYPQADAVLVHHWEVSSRPRQQLPPSPRPPRQRWVWFNMEPPDHSPRLKELDGYFNLTMSYRRDSDIFTPYGWLEPWSGPPAEAAVNLSAKTELVAWAVSNWKPTSVRVRYYETLREHLKVHVYGRSHEPLPRGDKMLEHLARYKFYLAFENSVHPDYITEKLWRNALMSGAVPVVLGPSRSNYEQFLPPDAFIHVDDFQSPRELAQYLLALDRDDGRYLSYFRWRETLRPRSSSWALMFCKACWQLQQEATYKTAPSLAAWFT